jgi:hypothetical protein
MEIIKPAFPTRDILDLIQKQGNVCIRSKEFPYDFIDMLEVFMIKI